MKYKYANKDHFLALARHADREQFNRRVNFEKLFDDMDPEGFSIVKFAMLHEHKAGFRVDPHMRTFWYVKLKGTMEPCELFLDISMENYDALPIFEYEENTLDGKEYEITK